MEKKDEKATAVQAAEETKAAEEPKTAAKKPRGRKPAAAKKADAPKKEAAPKQEPAARKTAAPKEGEEVIIQAGGGEWSVAALKEKARAAYAAEGHRASKNMVFYVKPEERKVYYVAGKNAGSVDFD